MSCSTKVLKIMLQIISGLYLIAGVVYIGMGIAFLVNVLTVPNEKPIVGWVFIIIGVLMTIFSLFGIYNVANENAGKVKVYGVIHLAMMILVIIGLVLNFDAIDIVSILISAGAAYLSFVLAHRFQNGHSSTINSA